MFITIAATNIDEKNYYIVTSYAPLYNSNQKLAEYNIYLDKEYRQTVLDRFHYDYL